MSIIDIFRDNGGNPLITSNNNDSTGKTIVIFDGSYSTVFTSLNGKKVYQEEVLRTINYLKSKGLNDSSPIYLIIFHKEIKMYNTPLPLVLLEDEITGYMSNAACDWVTFTNLSFKELLNHPDVLEKKGDTMNEILLVTDGQIGYGNITSDEKQRLLDELTKYIKQINDIYDCKINILTVEASDTNFNSPDESQVRNAAGADIASSPELIKYITRFMAYNGYHNEDPFIVTDNIQAVKGYVVYENVQIPISEIDIFLQALSIYLSSNPEPPNGSWNNTIRDVSLVAANKFTGRNHTENDPMRLLCIQSLIDMFVNISVSKPIVEFLVKNSFDNVKSGSVVVNTQLNSQLRQVWDQKLGGLQDRWLPFNYGFVSLPYKFYDGSYCIVYDSDSSVNYLDKSFYGKDKNEYKNSSIHTPNGIPIIMLPFLNDKPEAEFGQDLRLAVRTGQSHKNILDVQSREDFHIFYLASVACNMLYFSNETKDPTLLKIIDTYRYLTLNMLEKKVFMGKGHYSEETELSLIMKGNYPDKLIKKVFENSVINPFQFTEKEWWGMICTFLSKDHGPDIVNAQRAHLSEFSIDSIHSKYSEQFNTVKPVQLIKVNESQFNPPMCIITQEPIVGKAYKVKPFTTFSGVHVSPKYYFSQEGKDAFFSQERTLCLYSYHPIDISQIEEVELSNTSIDLSNFDKDLCKSAPSFNTNFFADGSGAGSSSSFAPSYSPSYSSGHALGSSGHASGSSNTIKKVLLLKGPPGCGKSTLVDEIKLAAEGRNETVSIVSVDRNVIAMGGNYQQVIGAAMRQTTNTMQSAFRNKTNWIIVDTCGSNGNKIFGVKKGVLESNGYQVVTIIPTTTENNVGDHKFLSWCLTNVLNRTQVGGTVTLTSELPIKQILIPYDRSIGNFSSNIQQSYRAWKNKFQDITNKDQILSIIKDDAESFVPNDIGTQVNSNF